MNQLTEKVTIGCLLHDIGKLIYRANNFDDRNHSKSGYDFILNFCTDESILQCVRYHHKSEITDSFIPDTSPAYIAYIADNIAAGTDRRLKGNNAQAKFEKKLPLYSIFNLLNGEFDGKSVSFANHFDKIPLPTSDETSITGSEYSKLVADMKIALSAVDYNKDFLNSLLEIMESFTSYVPSSTNTVEVADISLYDHSKITACIGSCICEYLTTHSIHDFQTVLYEKEKSFYEEKAFLMVSLDLSGIQNFIYSIDYEDALKSLRMRSFFLEIFMEHCIDTLLETVGLSRVNLIYSGGGHCYILLPNTDKVKEQIKEVCGFINRWLIDQFEASLHLAMAYVECSGNDLMNHPVEKSPYPNIFMQLSRQLSENKMNRYGAAEIRLLNKPAPNSSRECKICGKVSRLLNSKDICEWCEAFSSVSSAIFTSSIYVITHTAVPGLKGLRLPGIAGDVYLYFANKERAIELLKSGNAVRVYCKNAPCTGLSYANKIFVGDYAYSNLISDLLTDTSGIKRIAVLRMDVDNLGLAFIKGFERESQNAEVRYRYCTLSRMAAFSRQLSMFFKYYINLIMKELNDGQNKVSIVYSGGDDVFLIGAWKDVIHSAIQINDVFKRYSLNRLTISAGIGLFREKYPIFKSANDTKLLEEKSKSVEGKNSITLFTVQEDHTYSWDCFKEKVLDEKLKCIKDFFDAKDNEYGNAVLHRILSLLRESKDKINIARYVYLLAKLKPKSNEKQNKSYDTFCNHMLQWILDGDDRKQLITAIYIYLYSKRKRRDSYGLQ